MAGEAARNSAVDMKGIRPRPSGRELGPGLQSVQTVGLHFRRGGACIPMSVCYSMQMQLLSEKGEPGMELEVYSCHSDNL
jgi:hypothetical protein